jgi:hypothetical protein
MNVHSGRAAHAPSKRAVSIDEEAPRGAPSRENRAAASGKDEEAGAGETVLDEAAPGAAGTVAGFAPEAAR